MINWDTETETVAVADVKALAYSLTPGRLNEYMFNTETEPVEGGESYGWNHLVRGDIGDPDLYLIRNTGWGDYVGIMSNRCNWLYLTEHHDSEVVRLGRSEHDGQSLAIPATGRISVELADAIIALDEHAMLDDSMYGEVVLEVAQECWESYGEWDLQREVEQALGEDDLDWVNWHRVWQTACEEVGYMPWPEGATNVILWDDDVLTVAVDITRDEMLLKAGE